MAHTTAPLSDPHARIAELRASIPAKTQAQAQRLLRLIWAPETVGWTNSRPSGRFDRRAMGKLMAGGENVFRNRWERPGVNTAVSILIDLSSSMHDKMEGDPYDTTPRVGPSQIDLVQQLVLVMGAVFERARVKWELSGFNLVGGKNQIKSATIGRDGLLETGQERIDRRLLRDAGENASLRRREQVMRQYGNSKKDPLAIQGHAASWFGDLIVIKQDKETMRQAADTLSIIDKLPAGGTFDACGIVLAASRLAVKKDVQRKILFVMTDGEGQGSEAVKTATSLAEKMGVTIIGVGIKHNVVKKDYKVHAVVQNVEELFGKPLQIITQTVERLTPAWRNAG